MRRTAVFRDELFLRHNPGQNHIESAQRIQEIYGILDKMRQKSTLLEPQFPAASPEVLALNHTPAYIDMVARTAEQDFTILDPDTCACRESFAAASLAVGALTTGVDMLMDGEIDNGFALVRPPGHHAEKDRSMGFCIFNNVAIGARYALQHHGLQRILILDWDVHHGNGTQNAFYDRPDVLYCSAHRSPYFPGTGSLYETGRGEGEGYTFNIPLSRSLGDEEYGVLMRDFFLPLGRQYDPQLIIVSAGFDIASTDPLGGMEVTYQGIGYLMRSVVQLAENICEGKILVALEGGYSMKGQKEGCFAVLQELLGGTLPLDFPCALDDEIAKRIDEVEVYLPELVQAREVAKNYWSM